MTFYVRLGAAFIAALLVARVAIYWMASQKKRDAAKENALLAKTMDDVLGKYSERYNKLLEERDQKANQLLLERDQRSIEWARQRDADYVAKFEEMQRRLQGLAAKVGESIN